MVVKIKKNSFESVIDNVAWSLVCNKTLFIKRNDGITFTYPMSVIDSYITSIK